MNRTVLENFSIFTGKYLCRSLVLIKLHVRSAVNIVKFLRASILKNISKRLLKYLILRRSVKSSSNIFLFFTKQTVFFCLTNVRYILMFFWTWRWVKALFRTIIQGLIICYRRNNLRSKKRWTTREKERANTLYFVAYAITLFYSKW